MAARELPLPESPLTKAGGSVSPSTGHFFRNLAVESTALRCSLLNFPSAITLPKGVQLGNRLASDWAFNCEVRMAAMNRQTVDLSQYPDLVVIYLGMRVNKLRGVKTLFGFGPKISGSVD